MSGTPLADLIVLRQIAYGCGECAACRLGPAWADCLRGVGRVQYGTDPEPIRNSSTERES